MSVQIEPSELGFERPFNREVTQVLYIRNNGYEPVAFKVKTTAPKQYCVRPNSGRIEAGKEVEVLVHLQPMKTDPPTDFKSRDKFLVQSVPITADREAVPMAQIWAHVEKNDKSAILEKKIRVAFLQPGERETGGVNPDTSIIPAVDTIFQSPQQPRETIQTPPPVRTDSRAPPKSPEPVEAVEKQAPQQVQRAGDQDLSSANAKIAQLQEQLKLADMKAKKATTVVADKTDQITQGGVALASAPPGGVPVQVCASLCLLSFLIAWFFF
ncbi:VAMP-associated protein [Ascodesmis nigricans]|uniref:VAMP-associated protein n=1 Tax=Ascodesmis nigricans TaxID=341454 RepID=A0A4S2MV96_9PEZI|nr:VAMP-associated protein [Ascodesmis nigricans]